MKNMPRLSMIGLLSLLIVASLACTDEQDEQDEQEDLARSKQVQQSVMSNAMSAEPAYQPKVFPARIAINKYQKQTEEDGAWYTYALNLEGTPIFYVLSTFKPMNICVSLSSPDRVILSSGGFIAGVGSAPALDGVYYGPGCDAYYMFDATTDAMIELSGGMFTLVSSKVPMFLETDVKRLEMGSTDGE